MAPGAEEDMPVNVEVAGNDSQNVDNLALHSEGEVQSTLTKQQLRHRQPYAADDEVNDSIPDDGEKDVSKLKKSHGTFHHRKNSNASDDGNGNHGFLPGLMKKVGLRSQEFKEKDIHAADAAHPSGKRQCSGSHGFLPGLMKKAGFGSQEFKEKDMANTSEHGSGNHGFMGFMKRVGSQEIKHVDGDHYHHHHHPHGTRDKEIFGSEDADGNYREHEDLFGYRDMEHPHNIEKANSLFGNEDTEFERGKKGRDLFGDDDPNTLSFREKMNIVGPAETDEGEIERTRHIFGDENAEDSDNEVGSDDDLKREKKVHHGHSTSD